MNKSDQIKTLAIAIEEKDNTIRKLSAQMGNLEVQNSDYQQIVKELSDKLSLYEKKFGVVFKSSSKSSRILLWTALAHKCPRLQSSWPSEFLISKELYGNQDVSFQQPLTLKYSFDSLKLFNTQINLRAFRLWKLNNSWAPSNKS